MFAKNVFFSSVSYILNALVPILSIPLLLSHMGTGDYGKYIFYVTTFSVLSTVIDYNFSTYGIVHVVKTHSYSPVIARLLLGLITLMLTVTVLVVFEMTPPKITACFAIYIIFYCLNTQFFLTAIERTLPILYSTVLSKSVFLLMILIIKMDLYSALLCYVISIAFQGIFNFFATLYQIKLMNYTREGSIFAYFMKDFPSFIINILGFFAGNFHIFLAKIFLDPASFGVLTVYDRVVRSVIALYTSVVANLTPYFVSKNKGEAKYKKLFSVWLLICAVYLSMAIAIPISLSILGINFGDVKIGYNILYSSFVLWGLAAVTAGYFGVTYLIVEGMSRLYVQIYIVAIILGAGFLSLHSYGTTLRDVSYSILISECFIAFAVLWIFLRRRS